MASNVFESYDLESSGEWNLYIGRFQQYMKAQKVEPNLYTASLISSVGTPTYQLMCALCHPEQPENKTFNELVEIVANHCKPNHSVVAARYKFRKREQKHNEYIKDFIYQLRILAQTCEFNDKLEENLRDQLTAGVARDDIRQRLFLENNLGFARAQEIALSMEAAEQSCNITKVENIMIVKKKVASTSSRCFRCGRWHEEESEECPYLQFKCNICGEKGHLQKMCDQAPSTSAHIYVKREPYRKRRYNRDNNSGSY